MTKNFKAIGLRGKITEYHHEMPTNYVNVQGSTTYNVVPVDLNLKKMKKRRIGTIKFGRSTSF